MRASTEYNGDGTIKSQTDPAGLVTNYFYAVGKLSRITDPAGRSTDFYYNGNFLREVDYPDGTSTKYEYDLNTGLLTSEINQNNRSTTYVYNSWNRLEKVRRPDNSEITVNDAISGTMANNFVNGTNGIVKALDDPNTKDEIVDPNNVKTEIKKDESGYITVITDPRGKKTKIDRDKIGNPITVYRNYNSINESYESKIDYTYNSFGDQISVLDTEGNLTKTQTLNAQGDVLNEKSVTGITTTHTYDAGGLGLEVAVSNSAQGTIATIEYNHPLKLKTKVTNSISNVTTYNYDIDGNILSTTTTLAGSPSTVSSVTRDAAGNVLTSTNPKGETTQYEYDLWNRVIAVITPKNERTEYVYTPTGKLAMVKDANNETIEFTYDSMDRVIMKKDQLGKIFTYTYDNNSNLLTQTDPNNFTNVFTYDSLNQLKTKTTSEGVTNYTYNSKGEILTVASPNVALTFSYDTATEKLPIQATSHGLGTYSNKIPSSTITYEYNNLKQLIEISKVNTGYLANLTQDSLGRLSNVNGSMGNFTMSYDNLNRLTRINQTSGLSLTMSQNYAYDTQGFMTSLINRQGTNGVILSSQTYTRDQNGMRTGVSSTSGSTTVNRTLAYDGDQQLTSSNYTTSGTNQSFTNETYGYDNIHNRTSDEGGSYTYDSKNQRLTEDYRHFYFYDENGNVIKKQVKGSLTDITSYSYNSENQMIGFKIFDSSSLTVPIKEVTYLYDPMGRRVLKEIIDHVDTQKSFSRAYVYHNQEIIEEYDGDQNLLAQYGHSHLRTDDPLNMRVTSAGVTAGLASNSDTYSFLKDAQGTVSQIANSSGNVIQNYYYNNFGKILSIRNSSDVDVTSTPAIKTPFAFTGREYDSESGLYFYRARYYSPDIGRFLQTDPSPGKQTIPQTVANAYVYGINNPWNFLDPTGRSIFDFFVGLFVGIASAFTGGLVGIAVGSALGGGIAGAIAGLLAGAIVGTIVGAAIGGITNIIRGRDFGDNLGEYALAGTISGGLAGMFSGYNSKVSLTKDKLVDTSQVGKRTPPYPYGGKTIWIFEDLDPIESLIWQFYNKGKIGAPIKSLVIYPNVA